LAVVSRRLEVFFMHRRSLALLALSAALTALAVVPATPAYAQKKPPAKEEKKPANNNEAPMTKEPIKLVPEGMRWGMPREELEKLIDRFIDEDFKPKYKAASKSGPALKNLDAEVSTQKSSFRRSWIELTNGPTGLDSSPLLGEYTKGNGEAIMSHHRGPGVKIWFFFIGGRLWKTYEEVSLIKGGLYGETIEEAVKKLLDMVGGTNPRPIPANPDKGSFYDVFDWQDKETHMRLFDRSGVLAVIREEKATLSSLGSLRKNQGGAKEAMDPQVAAILRGAPEPPKDEKKEEKKDDKKDKGGKKK
jgi:hypothetical protein